MTQRLTADDFFVGLLAALSADGKTRTISVRGTKFDSAVEAAFKQLQDDADQEGVSVRFRVRTHPLHGDSSITRDAITAAAQRDLLSLDNPEFQDIRLKLGPDEAKGILERLPGGADLFEKLAHRFLAQYEQGATIA